MAKFFIDRPIFAIVISLIIVLAGALAALQLPISKYPQISPPTVSVRTNYVGANADVVNETVAQVIEQQVNGVQGMDYMSATTDDAGQYRLSVAFELGVDSDIATVKVQNAVATASKSLPEEVNDAGVTTKKASSDMAYLFSIYSPDGTYDRLFLKNYADIYLLDAIKRINGVGDVQIFGPSGAMKVWLNPDQLAELGLTVTDIIAVVQEQNVQAPAGTIGQQPSPELQEFQYTGKVKGRLTTPEEFANIIVKAMPNGSFLRLGDISRIEYTELTSNIESRFNNQTAVGIGINLTDDANALDVCNKVKALLEEADDNFPPGLERQEVYDSSKYVTTSLKEVLKTFMEALVLVVLVIFLFLQSVRATLIPVLAVPVSLIGTFAVFTMLGFSINTLTLFAMVLAIGLVVDDAIIVIENVEYHMRTAKLDAKEAAKRAMDEVSGPVVAIACVLASVFVPCAFLGGMMGVLYRQFALTIAVSMGLSAFVALTLTPALCAKMLKPHEQHKKKGVLDIFFRRFNIWFEKFTRGYVKGVRRCIAHSRLVCVALVAICGATVWLNSYVPSTFIPDEDQGFMATSVSLPEGTSLNRTRDLMEKVSADLQKTPGVRSVMSVIGYDVLSGSTKSNAGTMFVGMEDWDERTADDQQISAIIGKTFGLGAKYPESTILAFNPPSIPGLGIVGGFTMQLMDMTGLSNEELDAVTKKFVAAANQRPEVTGVYSTFKMNTPNYRFDVDREKAKNMGVTTSDIFMALQTNFGGYQVNDFNRFGRTYKVMIQADQQFRTEVDGTRFMYVRNNQGEMIPLDTLLTPKFETAPSTISRFNATRAIQINGSAAPGYSSGQAIAAMEEVAKEVLPSGFQVEWSGQSREEKKSSDATAQVIALALVFAFLCLAALYESWSIPIAVLISIPCGIIGAYAAQALVGLQNSIYMQIGLIMIIGLAAKNAILIVEFAKVRFDKGMDAIEAAVEGSKLRFRPILMTSFAFIIGCLPLALATGAGAAARNAMGTAVVGGMLSATIIGVFFIPVFFLLIERIRLRIKGIVQRFAKKHEL